jgi:hypothetical protein
MKQGFLCLVAVIDWFSRDTLALRLPNTMDVNFCTAALDDSANGRWPRGSSADQRAVHLPGLYRLTYAE